MFNGRNYTNFPDIPFGGVKIPEISYKYPIKKEQWVKDKHIIMLESL
jgi:hypothetical protein